MAYANATALAVNQVSRSAPVNLATAMAAVDGTNGNKFANDGRTLLRVKNASGGGVNVTIETPGTVDGQAIADLVVAVADGEDRLIGPFTATFHQPGTSDVYVAFSAATGVTAAAYRPVNS